jgi:hypothetical protein
MTAVRMSLRAFAMLTLLLGLVMWIFSLDQTPLVYVHIACAVLVLLLSVVMLFLPATVNGNNSTIRLFQGITLALVVVTMLVGFLQFSNDLILTRIVHLLLALIIVSLIEMTMARQNRIARASRAAEVKIG